MRKSKFIVFILSFLPGLSHLYVGFKERAVIFFIAFFGVLTGIGGLTILTGTDNFLAVLIFALPIIWFVALVDAIFLVDKLRNATINLAETENLAEQGLINFHNRKLIAVILSCIPGAGHMYLGLQKEGLQFMCMFFFTAFLMGWLNMSLFFFILPVIWFYSLFDAYHHSQGEPVERWEDDLFVVSWLKERPKWVGWGLVILGCIAIIERIITPLLDWQVRQLLQTGLVALILIVLGIRLITGKKENQVEEVSLECETGE